MRTFILISSLFLSLSAFAQPFSIDWHKVSGGGGTSTGGIYVVNGTIGQHDASNLMTNNSYVVTGGFWSLYAVQTPGAPALGIVITNGEAMVYWPSPSVGFSLQVNTNLPAGSWLAPGQTVTETGTIKYILVNPPAGQAYYRLAHP
jgi:hypothetical protein